MSFQLFNIALKNLSLQRIEKIENSDLQKNSIYIYIYSSKLLVYQISYLSRYKNM